MRLLQLKLDGLCKIAHQIIKDSGADDNVLKTLSEIEDKMFARGYIMKRGIKYGLLLQEEMDWLKSQYEKGLSNVKIN